MRYLFRDEDAIDHLNNTVITHNIGGNNLGAIYHDTGIVDLRFVK